MIEPQHFFGGYFHMRKVILNMTEHLEHVERKHD